MNNVTAMVLAGGRGKRMDVLCQHRPKPILPFGGMYRVIDYSLSNCVNSRIENVAALVDHLREEMTHYLIRWHGVNLRAKQFRVLAPRSGSYLGTADALYQNLDYIEKSGAELILVLAGDHVYQMDYRKMVAFHQKTKADVTVGVMPVPSHEVYRFGMVHTDAQGKITGFEEKPQVSRTDLASMGIYVFNKDTLLRHLIEDAANPASPHDFGYAILPRMCKKDKVYGYRFKDYWQDIGTTESYYEANMGLLNTRAALRINGEGTIFTADNTPFDIRGSQSGVVHNSIISPGCVIKGRVENSVLSPGVWVDEQAVVRNSVLMGNVSIGFHSMVEHAIVDDEVQVGAYCLIGFSGNAALEGNGITLLGKGATVPPHTAIGRGCTILPHVNAVDFRSKVVLPGSVLSSR